MKNSEKPMDVFVAGKNRETKKKYRKLQVHGKICK